MVFCATAEKEQARWFEFVVNTVRNNVNTDFLKEREKEKT